MFSGDSFPVGPNGQFPKQRVKTAGNELIPAVSMQETYLSGRNTAAKLPSIEKDFHSSVNKVKGRMKQGQVMRGRRRHGDMDRFRPRYAPKGLRGEEEYESMDYDPLYDSFGMRMDEGETDDSVGRVIGGRIVSSRMIGSQSLRPATGTRPAVIGSGGWLKGVQKLLGYP